MTPEEVRRIVREELASVQAEKDGPITCDLSGVVIPPDWVLFGDAPPDHPRDGSSRRPESGPR